MRKLENFCKSLAVLTRADGETARRDEIYRMGLIVRFNLTFELAWKALKEVLLLYGVDAAKTGSPREVLKEGYGARFLDDAEVWLDMMTRRNVSVHVYDPDAANELVGLIFAEYIPAFEKLSETLNEKVRALDD